MSDKPKVPKPGPAKLTPRAGLDEWLEQAKLCKYLPESAMKQLCEMVKECLMEGLCLPSDNIFVLTIAVRIQHSACFFTSHHLRRHSRPIL
jgi:hypothetical protein